jgi:hypothetical protein
MTIRRTTCVEIVCDNIDTVPRCDGGWDEGPVHFHDEAEAVDYAARAGWRITAGVILCNTCANAADCDRTGHRWGQWEDNQVYGVDCQRRWCEHCGTADLGPGYDEVVLMRQLQVIIDNAAARQAQDG